MRDETRAGGHGAGGSLVGIGAIDLEATLQPLERLAQLVIIPTVQATFDVVDDFEQSARASRIIFLLRPHDVFDNTLQPSRIVGIAINFDGSRRRRAALPRSARGVEKKGSASCN